MSNCITINGVENLPVEETLLIHYNILCTGEWYLSQLLTAYRSVCDSEWTVMYPNHQHPRHSDFPISVTQPGYGATFAWNYGGIQGISAEDFSSQHSYIVQLTLFEYGCFNTGQVVSGQGTGEPTYTGSTSGEATGSGGGPGQPEPPIVPGPGISTPALPGWGPGGGSGGGNPGAGNPRPPVPTPGIIPGPPGQGPGSGGGIPPRPTPGTLPGQGGGGGGGSSGTGQSSGNPIISGFTRRLIQPYPGNPGDPGIPGDPGQNITITNIGSQIQSNGNITNEVSYNPNTSALFRRPNQTNPGSTLNPNIAFNPLTTSSAIPKRTDSSFGVSPDLSNITNTSEGSIQGKAAGSLLGDSVLGSRISKQLNTKTLDKTAKISIEVLKSEVTIGEAIIASCFFCPTTEMEVMGKLTIQDSSKLIDVASTPYINTSTSRPLTLGSSSLSSLYLTGVLVLTFQVLDTAGRLIGVKSITVNNLEVNTAGIKTSSKTTHYRALPKEIVNYSYPVLTDSAYEIDLTDGLSKYLLFESTTEQTTISLVLQTDNDTNNNMAISLYVPSGEDTTTFTNDEFYPPDAPGPVGDINVTPVIKSNSKFKINGVEAFPHTHNVGIANVEIDPTYLVAVGIHKSVYNNSESSRGYLYVSNNFRLREPEASGFPDYIEGYMPFIKQKYGLVIHGKTPRVVPANYTVVETISSELGYIQYPDLTWSVGDYYSIIETKNGILNPFSTPVYLGQYI